ncbi:MAG: site-specific integrase [Clostridia bacterium]|nr:site-specific integrase [Clostridia bacterium]
MNRLTDFAAMLVNEEKSKLTVEKYVRDAKAFLSFCNGKPTREKVLAFKEHVKREYEITSANSMIAAVNSFLKFSGKSDMRVKQFRVQKKPFCPEEKELTREEYERLKKTAERKGNERLSLVLRSMCGTGVRVSELEYITVEAARRGEVAVSLKGKTRTVIIKTENAPAPAGAFFGVLS